LQPSFPKEVKEVTRPLRELLESNSVHGAAQFKDLAYIQHSCFQGNIVDSGMYVVMAMHLLYLGVPPQSWHAYCTQSSMNSARKEAAISILDERCMQLSREM